MTSLSRPLKPGDAVLTTEPFAHILDYEYWGKRCTFCTSECDSLKRCSGCELLMYCSGECQVKDWNAYHKLGECGIYKKASQNPLIRALLDDVWLTLRTYLLCKKKPEVMDKEYLLAEGTTRRFRDLAADQNSVVDRIFPPGIAQPLFRACVLDRFTPLIPDLDVDLFIDCMAKAKASSFTIDDRMGLVVGNGLFIALSGFKHSCRPNAELVDKGINVEIRVVRNIAAGEEITLSHIPVHFDRETRRTGLAQRNITCSCERCQEGDGGLDDTAFAEMAMMFHDMQMNDAEDPSRKRLRQLQFEVDLIRKKLSGIPYCYEITLRLFEILQHLSVMQRNSEDRQFQAELIPEVDRHLKVTHGTDDPLYRKFEMLKQLLSS